MTVATNAIVSYEEVMQYAESAGYTDISADNTFIENTINQKTKEFHKYCGVEQFKSRQYTEYYDGEGTSILFPFKTPILSVSSIYDDADWEYGSDSLIDSGSYKVIDKRRIVNKDNVFNKGRQNIKITYTAGYDSIPDDIKLACIREILREFNRRKDFDVAAKTLDDGTVSYVEKGLLKSTKDVLNRYRIIGIY